MGWGNLIGSAINATTHLIGQTGWLGNSASDSLHKSQTTHNLNNAFSYDKWRALNMPTLMKQGFKDAGMNPILVANNGSLPSGSMSSSMINSAKADIDVGKSFNDYYNRKVAKEDIRNRQKQNEVMDSQKQLNEATMSQLASSSAKNMADVQTAMALARKYETESERIKQEMKISSVSAKEAEMLRAFLDNFGKDNKLGDILRSKYLFDKTPRDVNMINDLYRVIVYGAEAEKHLHSSKQLDKIRYLDPNKPSYSDDVERLFKYSEINPLIMRGPDVRKMKSYNGKPYRDDEKDGVYDRYRKALPMMVNPFLRLMVR